MQYIESGYRGLSLVFVLNWDRLLALVAIGLGFYAGGYIASLFPHGF